MSSCLLRPPVVRGAAAHPLEQRRARQRVRHGEPHVVERKRGGEAQRVEHGLVGLAGVAHDEEGAHLQARPVGALHRRARLGDGDLLVHQRENLVVARLDAEEDAEAARLLHGARGLLVEGVDAAEALPAEAQAAPPDLLADGAYATRGECEDVVGERDALVTEPERLLDFVEHVLRRALAVRRAEHHVAAELAAVRAAARAHHGRDRGAVPAPREADVGGVGQQVAGGKGSASRSAANGRGGAQASPPSRAPPSARPSTTPGTAPRSAPASRAASSSTIVCSPSPRTTTSNVSPKAPGSHVGSGPPATSRSHRPRSAPAKPQGVLEHRRHGVDADDLSAGRPRGPHGLVAAQKCTVEEAHVVAGFAQGGGDVGDAEWREAEARAVERAPEERVDQQRLRHAGPSMRTW